MEWPQSKTLKPQDGLGVFALTVMISIQVKTRQDKFEIKGFE